MHVKPGQTACQLCHPPQFEEFTQVQGPTRLVYNVINAHELRNWEADPSACFCCFEFSVTSHTFVLFGAHMRLRELRRSAQ